MIEVDLSPSIINLDHLLPVIVLLTGFVMLDGFELVWESSSENKLISSMLEVRPYFLDYDLFVRIVMPVTQY